MSYPRKISYPTITVPQGQSESNVIDLDAGVVIGFIVPSVLEATTARLSFKAASTLGGTYKVVKVEGNKYFLNIAADDFGIFFADNDLVGVRFFKIVCETAAGVAVAQAGGDCVFEVIKVDAI